MYDVFNVRLHQTGSLPVPQAMPTTTIPIKFGASFPNFNYDTLSDSSVASRFNIASSRSTISTVAVSSTTNIWVKSASAILVVTFLDSTQARHFFNAGAKIRIRVSRTGGSGTAHNVSWTGILNLAGIQTLRGTLEPVLNFYTLTDQYQTMYQTAGISPYSQNNYSLKVKCDVPDNSNGGARILTFTIDLIDDHVVWDPTLSIPSPLYNDKVDGTLAIRVEELKDSSPIQPSGNFNTIGPSYYLSNIALDGAAVIGPP